MRICGRLKTLGKCSRCSLAVVFSERVVLGGDGVEDVNGGVVIWLVLHDGQLFEQFLLRGFSSLGFRVDLP